ncbi:MAG: adenine-specific methyltransferase EcoRI family protein [Bacteroidales bacterium]|nr:adenine-specific methyltransferase EcoRI family protein [Bacteroidales bacterium]
MARISTNKDLHKAKDAKKDEFYTQLSDIERELKSYERHFKNKVVYCNCDDPYESNFFKYFAQNFNFLGLKKLIATCYTGSPIANTQISLFDDESEENKTTRVPHKIEITEIPDMNNGGAVDLADVEILLGSNKNYLTRLKGDGDFRSKECIELLKQSDIVVTNPPFSLFREYVEQLVKYEKQFLIIGNINAITYKEIFKLIKENKAWLGINMGRGISGFIVPDQYNLYGTETHIDSFGNRIISTNNCLWLTNLDTYKRHEDIVLTKTYYGNESQYPKFDNYDAINVNKTKDIPMDYNGVMGVPITFLHKFNPAQFELIKFRKGNDEKDLSIDGKCPYFRILIKNKKAIKK